MQDQAFAAAVRPAPRRILRCSLLPFSIGHELLLFREGNSLLLDKSLFGELTAEQRCFAVVRAVQICSRTWRQNQRPDRWVRLWSRLIRREDPDGAAEEFRSYRDEGSTFPPIKPEKGSDTRELGAPFLARLIAFAGPIFGQAVFDQPLGMIQWLYFAHVEYEGGCKVKNAFDLQVDAEIAQHQADYEREQEEKAAHAGP